MNKARPDWRTDAGEGAYLDHPDRVNPEGGWERGGIPGGGGAINRMRQISEEPGGYWTEGKSQGRFVKSSPDDTGGGAYPAYYNATSRRRRQFDAAVQ